NVVRLRLTLAGSDTTTLLMSGTPHSTAASPAGQRDSHAEAPRNRSCLLFSAPLSPLRKTSSYSNSWELGRKLRAAAHAARELAPPRERWADYTACSSQNRRFAAEFIIFAIYKPMYTN